MGEILVGIDIGTTKVCTIIGKVSRSNNLEILGKGIEPCIGVKKGIIVDIESTSNSIRASVEKAEANANLKVKSAFVNIAGAHVSVISNRGTILISNDNREINSKDIEKVLYNARNIEIAEDMQIIDIIPRQYIIDGYDEILDPVGMVGVKLEADVDVVTAKITSVQNIIRSMERAGLRIDGIVVQSMVASEIAISNDEKEMGVILIDVGGGITDISFIKNKKIKFYSSIPVGGEHITNDISIGIKIQYQEAEKLKRQYQLALTSLIENDQHIHVVDSNDNKKKTIKVSEMVEIVEARVYELFSLCKSSLENAGICLDNAQSIVLIGGGISFLDGGIQLATEVFGIPGRVSSVRFDSDTKSEYMIAAGTIKYIYNSRKTNGSDVIIPPSKKMRKKESGFKKLFAKFFNDLF